MTDLIALLREALNTLDMWADVAPAVSLRADIRAALAREQAAQPALHRECATMPEEERCSKCRAAQPAAQEPGDAYDMVEAQIVSRYRVEKTRSGFWPSCVKAVGGEMELFIGRTSQCEQVAAALQTACLDGAFMASKAAAQPAAQEPRK